MFYRGVFKRISRRVVLQVAGARVVNSACGFLCFLPWPSIGGCFVDVSAMRYCSAR